MSQPSYWQQACSQLAENDSVMRALIAEYPDIHLTQRGDPFTTLARSIIGQQISVKAADTVWQRFTGLLANTAIVPQQLADTPAELLRTAGLSRQKISYLHDLAQHALDGRFNPPLWHTLDDAQVIRALTDIKGVGRWTAEMFLIFALQRPDVLPVADIGLQKAIARWYFHHERPSATEIHRLANQLWRPWCSVATWYLWRSLDPDIVAY